MRLRRPGFVVPVVVALTTVVTPGLQAQVSPDADERSRQAPGAPQQRQPRAAPRLPDRPRPFPNPRPFDDRRFFDRRDLATQRENRVVCGTTIIPANPDTDRRMLRPAPEGRATMRLVRPDICVD